MNYWHRIFTNIKLILMSIICVFSWEGLTAQTFPSFTYSGRIVDDRG